MPELPDITLYIEALEARVKGEPLERVRVAAPFLLKTFDPPVSACEGKRVLAVRRVGKRIAFALAGDLFLVLHLMIAGRLHWKGPKAKLAGKTALAALDFPRGTLLFTEASAKHRAAMHVVRGEAGLAPLAPTGVEPLEATFEAFDAALRVENHTLKRALTDPRLFSGIGNAYSDEILHRARLSPVALTSRLSADDARALFEATRATLVAWTDRLRAEARGAFPERVTAFRPDFAVHGRFGKPCPVCGTSVQRIARAENESNYCPRCQTGGKMLADRALSKLLHDDWPKTIDAWEEKIGSATLGGASAPSGSFQSDKARRRVR
ncbi:MAG: Fpg/Nei family DNA glycosylase [Thermoplasmatota archaeon]